MKDNYSILIDEKFKLNIQSILNGFSEPHDLILFKYEVMKLIKEKINIAGQDPLFFEKNIDKEIRLKHNETSIIDANYIIDLIHSSEIPVTFFFEFINDIENVAKTKDSYKELPKAKVSKLSI